MILCIVNNILRIRNNYFPSNSLTDRHVESAFGGNQGWEETKITKCLRFRPPAKKMIIVIITRHAKIDVCRNIYCSLVQKLSFIIYIYETARLTPPLRQLAKL